MIRPPSAIPLPSSSCGVRVERQRAWKERTGAKMRQAGGCLRNEGEKV